MGKLSEQACSLKKQANDFLKKYDMHYESIDILTECNKFITEMEKGLGNEGSSLDMINTYISLGEDIPLEKPVIVIDAGGTNFRVALVTFNREGHPVIDHFNTYPMPGTKGEISKAEFYSTIVDYLEPVINKSDRIGFCFSFPTEILPNKDGRLSGFNKEVRVRDMTGELVGSGLLKAIRDAGIPGEKKIVMLNDTVATLLGGKAACPGRKFDSFIGFILGTGTNTCYAEDNLKILKSPELASQKGSTLINIESGGYALAPRGRFDIEFDNSTSNPGDHKFEKMISGAYQGGAMFVILKAAAKEGLFSQKTAQAIASLTDLAAKDINDYCEYPYNCDNPLSICIGKGSPEELERDSITLYYLLDAFYERAARFVTINLAAVILKTGKGRNPCLPVCITAEGTTFYKTKLFKSKLDCYVRQYIIDDMGRYCDFVRAENATLVGTAIAGLQN